MANVHSILPVLTLNKLLIRDLIAADVPYFVLSYVEEKGKISGFIALRPNHAIPESSSKQGFRFGHSVLSLNDNPVLHFAFEFYGHKTYHGLVNPGSVLAQSVTGAKMGLSAPNKRMAAP